MKVTIYGTGYVGLVTGTCLAELGHEVLCIDINQEKIQQLQDGVIPIYEPGLDELVIKNVASKNLKFSSDAEHGVSHGQLQFICVNTPGDETGAANISNVINVAKTIAKHMNEYKLIINKSTAPVGTAAMLKQHVQACLKDLEKDIEFDLASNPEFLKEGSAIKDFMQADRIVVGCDSDQSKALLRVLYQPLTAQNIPLVIMDIPSAELCKYAANAMLATKISFINEIANIAERVGADIESVRHGMSLDPRIGPHFISPGCGYGGSCFPKDVKALAQLARAKALEPDLLLAVDAVNQRQKSVLCHKLEKIFSGDLNNKCIAVWGLAFKPNTDDIREASSRVLLEELWNHGAKVQAYDPVAMDEIHHLYGKRSDLTLCQNEVECLEQADALVIVTEWPQFKDIDLGLIKSKLTQPIIIDGRNLLSKTKVLDLGFEYFGIGR